MASVSKAECLYVLTPLLYRLERAVDRVTTAVLCSDWLDTETPTEQQWSDFFEVYHRWNLPERLEEIEELISDENLQALELHDFGQMLCAIDYLNQNDDRNKIVEASNVWMDLCQEFYESVNNAHIRCFGEWGTKFLRGHCEEAPLEEIQRFAEILSIVVYGKFLGGDLGMIPSMRSFLGGLPRALGCR